MPECILVILAVTAADAQCGVYVSSHRDGRIKLFREGP